VSNKELFKRYYLDYYKTYSKDDLAFYCSTVLEYNRLITETYKGNV
jgi:hypothetical protein